MSKDPIEQIMYDYKTLDMAIRSLREVIHFNRLMPTYSSMDEQIYSLVNKVDTKCKIDEIVLNLNPELKLVWELRYIKNRDVDIICEDLHISKSTYHRLRRKLREFMGKSFGYL